MKAQLQELQTEQVSMGKSLGTVEKDTCMAYALPCERTSRGSRESSLLLQLAGKRSA